MADSTNTKQTNYYLGQEIGIEIGPNFLKAKMGIGKVFMFWHKKVYDIEIETYDIFKRIKENKKDILESRNIYEKFNKRLMALEKQYTRISKSSIDSEYVRESKRKTTHYLEKSRDALGELWRRQRLNYIKQHKSDLKRLDVKNMLQVSRRVNSLDDILIEIDDLAYAINNKLLEKKDYISAKKTAFLVKNFFGYSDRMLDNILKQDERDLFYSLESKDFLKAEVEDNNLYDGREWRTHYWSFKKESIFEAMKKAKKTIIEEVDVEDEFAAELYNEIPDDVWQRDSD